MPVMKTSVGPSRADNAAASPEQHRISGALGAFEFAFRTIPDNSHFSARLAAAIRHPGLPVIVPGRKPPPTTTGGI